jgi:protein SCO1
MDKGATSDLNATGQRGQILTRRRHGCGLAQQRQRHSHRFPFAIACVLSVAIAIAGAGCGRRKAQLPPGIFGPATHNDCLPNVNFVDQHGNAVSFSSFKGKWLLVDFIYTRCPGPCELMTTKLVHVADHLSAQLGKNVEFVSISLDPEHDRPEQLLKWAQAQNAQRKGWLFLTGSLPDVERVMAAFNVKRRVHPNGDIDHVIEFFLVGPHGYERRQYSPNEAKAEAVAADVLKLAG